MPIDSAAALRARAPGRELERSLRQATVAVAFCATFVAVLWFKGGGNDFGKAYYPAARSIVETGTFTYTYESVKNIPIVVALLTPFALNGRMHGEILLLVVNQLAYVLAFVMLARTLARTTRDIWVLAVLFILCTHLRTSVALGQTTPLCFLLVATAVVAYLRHQFVLAGTALGAAFLLKIPVGLLLLLPARHANGRAVGAAAALITSAVAISILLFGWPLHVDYWELVIATNAGTTLLAANNQNVFSLAMRYLSPPSFFDWTTVLVPPLLYRAIVVVIGAWVLVLMARFIRPRPARQGDTLLEFSLLICTALIVFPVSWNHYYVLLLIPLFCLYLRLDGMRTAERVAALVAAILVNLSTDSLAELAIGPPAFQVSVVSLPVLGCVLLLVLLVRAHGRALGD